MKNQEYESTLKQFLIEAPHIKNKEMELILRKLHRYETTLHRLAEKECNEGLTKEDREKEEKTEKSVKLMAVRLRFKVQFNGDPRGGAIRFTLPSKRSNNWGGDWSINW